VDDECKPLPMSVVIQLHRTAANPAETSDDCLLIVNPPTAAEASATATKAKPTAAKAVAAREAGAYTRSLFSST
jgi:hypothetical protein